MSSGLDDSEIDELAAPKDLGADGSDLLASSLELAGGEIASGGLDLIVDRHTVE